MGRPSRGLLWGLFGLAGAGKPNIIFIMTDDQDAMLDSMKYMPHVQELLAKEGTTFDQHRVNEPVCCPSRTTVLTGMKAHNTNVTTVPPPYGGIWRYEQLVGEKSIGLLLQKLGYSTHCLGKMMAGYMLQNTTHKGPGWDDWRVLIDPFTYNFNRTVISVNGLPMFYPLRHQTEVLAAHTKGILSKLHTKAKRARANGLDPDPFFLYLTPVAPHDEVMLDRGCKNPASFPLQPPKLCVLDFPPSPIKRHRELFKDVRLPRTDNFNPGDDIMKQKGPAWIHNLQLLNQTQENWLDFHYQQRLRALQGVDEMVADIVAQLEQQGMLDDTYIFYTADNGFHLGHFRLGPTKLMPYENEVKVPLIVRGPGVPKGVVSHALTSNIDFFGAFASIAGASETPSWVDGLPNFLSPSQPPREILEFEYFGAFISQRPAEFPIPKQFATKGQIPMDYAGVVTKPDASTGAGNLHMKYIYWCDNTWEMYNLTADPLELHNLLHQTRPEDVDDDTRRLWDRLDAITQVLRTCAGAACRQPLAAFRLPDGRSPATLTEALQSTFDAAFAVADRPHFDECLLGHLAENERPRRPSSSSFVEVQPPTRAAPPLEPLLSGTELLEAEVSAEGQAEVLALAMEVLPGDFGAAFQHVLGHMAAAEAEAAAAIMSSEAPIERSADQPYFFGDLDSAEAVLATGVQLPGIPLAERKEPTGLVV